MNEPAADTLFKFLEKESGIINNQALSLFLRAQFHPYLHKFKNLICAQSFFPYAKDIESQKLKLIKDLDSLPSTPSTIIYLPTSQKNENLYNFARCYQALPNGGKIICCMANNIGAKRFEDYLTDLFGNIESSSKNKCRIFWAEKTDNKSDKVNDWLKGGELKVVEDTGLLCRAGVFGWEKVDEGSALLCENLPQILKGHGADPGCGYGYISNFILKNIKEVEGVSLYDAEGIALECAKLNLKKYEKNFKLEYVWGDVTRGMNLENIDWVVMNPPFHIGKTTDPKIGMKFIVSAAKSLKPQGVLYLVCNKKLPYEDILSQNFSSFERIAQNKNFKVVKAIK